MQRKTTKTTSVNDADYAALAAFRSALREFLSFSESAARAAGLTPQQHQALLAIRGAPGAMSVGELAADLQLRPHSALELVDRLVTAGLIEKRVGETDRRRVEVFPTRQAEAVLSKLSVAHINELRHRRALLRKLLDRLGD